ncbi:MAG: hypothetical protein H0W84_14590 [Bacteroidetes bacterium]|nr:hypothetical protein [Bacteroidota bacterium]
MKKMKQLLGIIVAIFIFNNTNANTLTINANDSIKSGIYMSAEDFLNKKLAFEINCSTSSHKINTHEFLSKPYIDITHEGKKYRLKKDSIFGYRDCEGNDFRLYNDKEYKILETAGVTIYMNEVAKSENKQFKLVPYYFFSVKTDGGIVELTKLNLKNAFPDNHKFHDMIDAQFKDETELPLYDSFHKSYKVNHLLHMSYQ